MLMLIERWPFSTQLSQSAIPMSYFSHLECSVPVRRGPLRPASASSISARAALPCSPATISTRRARWTARRRSPGGAPNMWRYRELMPLFDGEEPLTLGEGWTPLIHAQRLGA